MVPLLDVDITQKCPGPFKERETLAQGPRPLANKRVAGRVT
jgi:hypothetical protein